MTEIGLGFVTETCRGHVAGLSNLPCSEASRNLHGSTQRTGVRRAVHTCVNIQQDMCILVHTPRLAFPLRPHTSDTCFFIPSHDRLFLQNLTLTHSSGISSRPLASYTGHGGVSVRLQTLHYEEDPRDLKRVSSQT